MTVDLTRSGAQLGTRYSHATGDTLVSIENLTGSTHNDTLTGNAVANVLEGGEGIDVLKGQAGNDYLYGGAGNDELKGGADNDHLYGGAGIDDLEGGAGNDHLYGGDGSDHLKGEADNDHLYGEDGSDYLEGGAGTDRLYGGAGVDVLKGQAGTDYLEGGAGADWLYGGTGADTFIFNETSDSPVAAPDVVKDFSGLGADGVKQDGEDGDKLDLRGLKDASDNTTLRLADSGAGRVWYSHRAGNTTDDVTTNDRLTDVFVDLDGNGRADFQVTLEGATDITLTAADFLGVEAAIA